VGIWYFDLRSVVTQVFIASQVGVPHTYVSYSVESDCVRWVEPQFCLFDAPSVHAVSRLDIEDMLARVYPARRPCNSPTMHQISGMQEVA
jgi:hypothetical protein